MKEFKTLLRTTFWKMSDKITFTDLRFLIKIHRKCSKNSQNLIRNTYLKWNYHQECLVLVTCLPYQLGADCVAAKHFSGSHMEFGDRERNLFREVLWAKTDDVRNHTVILTKSFKIRWKYTESMFVCT